MSTPAVMSPSSLSDVLSPRPPTPPRETRQEVSAPVPSKLPILDSLDSPSALHTPPGNHSPSSSATTNSTTRRLRKKVGFSAQAEYKDPPTYVDGVAARAQQPTPLSLPRSASKPVKSILKATNHAPNPLEAATGTESESASQNTSLAAMLESTIQQLAGGDRDSKVDAYLMLTRAWKASNNLPDRVALQEKMGLFMQFMQRDILSKNPEGAIDASLVNHALNLLITFLGFPAIASTFTNDFGVFIIDHCIRSFEDPSLPKDVARRFMQVISLQNFSPKVMTSDRVGRLISALHHIEKHLKGKSIIMSRVLIYRKLVKQSKTLMVVHSDWLFDLFTDMLSSLQDIRLSAIALGFEAAFTVGHEKLFSRKVMEVFSSVSEEKRYIQYYEEKLKALVKDKRDSAVVPQIWSVVILLLRIPLDKWEFTAPWLHIIQSCFNSPDFSTKISANYAWGRLAYMMNLDDRSFAKHLPTLTQPLISQLRRKGTAKPSSEELRKAVLGGICNLLYYTFKPHTSPALLDGYWEACVKPIIAKLLDPAAEAAMDNTRQASSILGGLFDSTTPRRWREDHIVENPLVKPEELPAIDPKWIRRNATKVFLALEPIFQRDFLALADSSSATYKLWRSLVSTVASAASKEIKVSKDTAVFVTEALNELQKVWNDGLPIDADTEAVVNFLLAVRAYLEIMISSLGLLPFTEKPGKNQTFTKAPLFALFSMLSSLPPRVPDDEAFAGFYASVFAPFFASKADKLSMDLAQDLLLTIPLETPRPYGPWVLVASKIAKWLEPGHSSHQSTGSGSEVPIGQEYRDIVKVLERGIRSTPNLPWKHWESLFYSLFDRVRDEIGDAGVAMVAIEPLAKILPDQFVLDASGSVPENSFRCVIELMTVATHPRDRQAVDAARRRLWGTALAGARSSSFDTFDNLYKAVNEALICMYTAFSPTDSDAVARLLKEVGEFFDRGNQQLFFRSVIALQDGYLPWLRDSKRLLKSPASPVLAVTKSLWDKLSNLILGVEHPEQHLEALERLFCAAFESSHRYIVSSSVSLWNKLFEHVEHLEYPEQLKAALGQLQPHVDIVLPGLEMSSSHHAGQRPLFVDSMEDFSLPQLPSARSSRRGTPRPASGSRSKTPDSSKLNPTPKPKTIGSRAIGSSRRNTPRLRHDDSQIQFAAIEPSSPTKSHVELQLLTERQKEVRDRQKETAALFPEIRSSPGVKSEDPTGVTQPELPMPQDNPRNRQATTPEPERAFDDFITSTPTPRRGQPVAIPEHDMNDPPSSPPEPRRNPLAAEIRSRSVSHSLLDEWQFLSSPISGSPNPNRQAAVPEASSHGDLDGDAIMHEAGEELPSPNGAGGNRAAPKISSESDVINDSFVSKHVDLIHPINFNESAAEVTPKTPRKSARISRSQVTPKLDTEVFVDARSSPQLPTPKRSERLAKTSRLSGIRDSPTVSLDKPSLLVVELNSDLLDREDYVRPSVSPPKKMVKPTGGSQKLPALDCIIVSDTVDDSPKQPTGRGSKRSSRSSSAALTVPLTTADQHIPSSLPQGQEGGHKRKRVSSRARETGNKKRKLTDPVNETDVVLSSQPALVEDVTKLNRNMDQDWPSSSSSCSLSTAPSEDNSQEVAIPETMVSMEVDAILSDDQEVQSQIALESRNHYPETNNVGHASPKQHADDLESSQVDMLQLSSDGPTKQVDATNASAAKVPDEEEKEVDYSTDTKPGDLEQIMNMLRSGLDGLRSAKLSRQEVYQVEDVFMDIKRELYEAEKRGRA
ncbi:Rap1-interacting factor 1 N terminal-domain-containing protein [Podospora didyma]|uniref:Rap1-interacting factor 1 N terminal-domain-containing protein n=1 Tax=Podospora didyma TaxID=330526 RepID=A0AAE0U7I9_9PEZI|nr:Rap1-interacting factor 1 N terminal-domain-containing protein [Podospora didyma]